MQKREVWNLGKIESYLTICKSEMKQIRVLQKVMISPYIWDKSSGYEKIKTSKQGDSKNRLSGR